MMPGDTDLEPDRPGLTGLGDAPAGTMAAKFLSIPP